MANRKYVELLKQGVEIWNQWREEHREIEPDLLMVDLHERDLSKVAFNRTNLSCANLSGTNLSRSVLAGANITKAKLKQANLSGAYLGGADLSHADLRGADLRGARLFQADLRGARLGGANLSGADLSETNFIRTDLSDAIMEGAYLGSTVFVDVDLRRVQGLEHAIHKCRSYLSLDIAMNSRGQLPVAFLQGVGFSDDVISALRSDGMLALDGPLQSSYACFISYAKNVARRLHEDLQRLGVRCWLDLEDHLDDVLRFSIPHILVLSQHSVQLDWRTSQKPDWVFQEVIDALATEREQESQVLFPVRLDETILYSKDDWAEELSQSRAIDDFTRWKDDTTYQQSLSRLLRTLKGEK